MLKKEINARRIAKNELNQEIYSLYIHIFPNNKVYIGITKYIPKYRWGKNGNGYKDQIVWSAIQKYGWKNIKHEILLETTDKDFVEHEERRYITEVYHSNDDEFGYNIDLGGRYAGKLSEAQKQRLREVNLGKKQSEETKKKRADSIRGIKRSEETRKRQSEAAKGRIFTKEHCQRISESKKGKPIKRKKPGMSKDEKRIRHNELERIRRQDPAYRKKINDRKKELKKDPIYRAEYNRKRREERKRRKLRLFLLILWLNDYIRTTNDNILF